MQQILEPGAPSAIPESSISASLAAGKSAVSWAAIAAGAFVAAAVSLILLALGSGLGFASVSPWPGHGVSATTFAVTTAIWLIVMQWVSSGVGGYIAGRLRTKWVGTHTHEVFFRDTAHGFVTWAVATVLIAAVLAASAFMAIGGAVHTAQRLAPGDGSPSAANGASGADAYGVDKLFRPASPGVSRDSTTASDEAKSEARHIAANAVASGGLPDSDRNYLAQAIAARTGVPEADAQRRVDDFIGSVMADEAKVKTAANAARKAAAQAAIYTALSMLIGAFIGCVAAVLGGRLRDQHI